MTQFKGSATVFRVLKALEWHEKADDLSLPSDSYAAIPTLDRDEVNNIDRPLLWEISSGGRTLMMSASQAYSFALDRLLQVDGHRNNFDHRRLL
jgi:hypothetical protein